MQKSKGKKKSLLFNRSTALAGWPETQANPTLADSPKWSIYESCNDMPLSVFEKVYIKEELKYLAFEGVAPDEVLKEAWDKIYGEYLHLMGETKTIELLYKMSRLNALKSRLSRMFEAIRAIRVAHHPIIVKIFKEEGYKFSYSPETLISDLSKTERLLIRDRIEHDKLEREIEKEKNADVSDKKNTNYFSEALIQYETCFKVFIEKSKISVADFCLRMKQMRDYIDQQNAAHG